MADKKRPVSARKGKAERSSKKTAPASPLAKSSDKAPGQALKKELPQKKKAMVDHARDLPSESEETYRFLVENISDVVWRISPDLRFTYASPAAEHQWGYKREEVVGRSIFDFMTPSSAVRIREIAGERQRQANQGRRIGKMIYEIEQVCKDGRLRSTEVISDPIYGPDDRLTGFQGVTRDITDRKQAEGEVAKRGAMLQQIMDTASVAIGLVDKTGRITHANRRMAEMFGRTLKELIGFEYVELVHPSEREIGKKNMLALLASEIPSVDLERLYRRKDGTEFWGHLACRRFNDVRGDNLGLIGVITDITERKVAEDKLWESEDKFRSIFEQAIDGIMIADIATKRNVEANRAICSLLGYTHDELISRTVEDLHPKKDLPHVLDLFERQARGVLSLATDVPMLRKDGSVVTVDVNAIRVTLGGKPRIIGIFRDITERKKADEESREKEGRYRVLFEAANDGIFIYDAVGFRDSNQRGADMYGLPKEKLIGRSPIDFSPERQPDGRLSSEAAGEKIQAALNGVPQLFEWLSLRADGTQFDVEITLSRFELGGSMCLQAIVRDIAERKRADAALREREKQLAESQRIAHIGSWEHNLTTNKVVWSDELFRLMGLDPRKDPADFKMFFDRIHPDDQPALRKGIEETVKTGNQFSVDYRFTLPDGRTRILHAQAELRHDETGTQSILSGIGQDITERKEAEEKVRQSEAKYRNLFESSTDGIFIIDLDGNFVDVNTTAFTRLGYTKEEMLALHLSKLDHPNFAPRVAERLAQIREHGFSVFESAHLRKDGAAMPVEVNSRLMEYEGKTVYFSVIRDITERKEAEEKIRQSEEFIRSILDTVDEGFVVIDRDYRILTANKSYCKQVGGCDETIIGQHCYAISHKKARPCYDEGEECAVRQTFATGEPHTVVHKNLDQEGHMLFVESKAYPIKDQAGHITSVIETINNITERHLLEEERLKTQKLESIGTLAGGIAHDFNNLLQGIFGYISMAKMTFDQKEKSLAMLEQAEKALHQSVTLTTQLLTFSKGGKPVKKLIDLRPVIENSAKFTLSGSRSDIRMNLPEDLWHAEVDEGQLGQVIQNIVLNADQAMPLGGSIVIDARNVVPVDAALPLFLANGNYVEIAIQDTGVGIPEQYLSKIFDPYFTTKEKGSGLGLATTYSIVRNHGGTIDIRTKSGEGSTFLIYLPAIAGEGRIASAVSSEEPSLQRSARVLVMDDEEFIRNLSSELLGALGHTAEVAQHGQEALEKYRGAMAAGKPFDIVILDLTVRGGMGGSETVQMLLEIDPAVKAIVSSGYSDDEAMANYEKQGFKAFLKKPYDVDALSEILNRVLNN